MMTSNFDVSPFVVIWENTRACDLACVHCRAAAQSRRSQFELTTEEGFRLIDEVAVMKPKVFVLTGGDPLKRDDTYAMISRARDKGLEPSLTPSATPLLTEDAVQRMKDAGLGRMAVSLDGADAASHDAFRRVDGSFDITLRAVRKAKQIDIPVQVNSTVTKRTLGELPKMVETLTDLGIVMWSVFIVVPTGRAKSSDVVTPQDMEDVFAYLYKTSKTVPFSIRTTEGMHYRRYVMQQMGVVARDPLTGLVDGSTVPMLGVRMQHGGITRAPRGVNEGKGFVFVSHIGDVFPSGFLPLKAGNVKNESLARIYRDSPLFLSLRDTNNLKGKCGRCEYRDLCGGSRARAWAMTGDVFESDPLCSYQPAVA